MEDWRRNRGENRNPHHRYQPFSKPFKGSHYRKPDSVDAEIPSWVHSVPSWEKKFIIHVGKMPWGRFMHCQKVLDHEGAVFQWDDSAGRDAFQNAKSRYWAEIKGLYCDISLPDQNMYIQEIDWNAKTDPQLYEDLEIDPEVDEKDVNGEDDYMWNMDQPIVPTGWGDEEANWKGDDKKAGNKDNQWTSGPDRWDGVGWGANCLSSLMKPIIPSGSGDAADSPSKTNKGNWCKPSSQNDDDNIKPWNDKCAAWQGVEPWGRGTAMKNTTSSPWEDQRGGWEGLPPWGQSSGTKNTNSSPWEDRPRGWEGVAPWGQSNGTKNIARDSENPYYSRNNVNWKSGNEKWRKRESEDHHLSRYKTTRYHGDDYPLNNGWRNDSGKKRVSFAHEQSPVEPVPSPQQWNSFQNCGPISQHRPRGWEKNVSHRIN